MVQQYLGPTSAGRQQVLGAIKYGDQHRAERSGAVWANDAAQVGSDRGPLGTVHLNPFDNSLCAGCQPNARHISVVAVCCEAAVSTLIVRYMLNASTPQPGIPLAWRSLSQCQVRLRPLLMYAVSAVCTQPWCDGVRPLIFRMQIAITHQLIRNLSLEAQV